MKKSGKKLLWGTANLFSNPRYMHGAGTSCNPDAFAFAAAQVKKALEITVRLNGSGYTFWGGREGYETLLNTNMGLELDNMARFLRLTTEYGRSIGFKGAYYIEPKPKEPTKHQYDFDAATVIGFLRKYGFDMKLNLEANHGTLAGHTFQHPTVKKSTITGVAPDGARALIPARPAGERNSREGDGHRPQCGRFVGRPARRSATAPVSCSSGPAVKTCFQRPHSTTRPRHNPPASQSSSA